MSRARQVANFDPALFTADEVSGDKVSGGTIGAGVIGASVTGGAGLTGSTSLGTVTVGNLSHADIVYPDGHVVQIGDFNPDAEDWTTSSSTSFGTAIRTYTTTFNVSQGNKVFAIFQSGLAYITDSNGGVKCITQIELTDGTNTANRQQPHTLQYNSEVSTNRDVTSQMITVLLTTAGSSGTVNVSAKLYLRTTTTSNDAVYTDQSGQSVDSHITMFEIVA